MKILLVGSSLYDWGGIERYVLYQAQGLVERGHEVKVTCPSGTPLARHVGELQKPLALRAQFDLRRVAKYMRLYRRWKPDIVNVHFSPDYIVPGLAAKMAKQKGTVLTRHLVLPWKPGKVRLYSRLYSRFIGVADAVERVLVDSGVPAKRITVAKGGCPALEPQRSREDVRRSLGLDSFTVGFFGRLTEQKGLATFIEAARQSPSAGFAVFGDGPLREQVQAAVGKNLSYHGRVSDVADAMNAVDAVAVPSIWEEAFPYSVLEAMSLGKPVLASRSGGLPEMVEERKTGLIHEKGDAAELAEHVKLLEREPGATRGMGEAGQQRHRNEFTVPHMAERMERAFEWVLS